jgi:hypothetical protein
MAHINGEKSGGRTKGTPNKSKDEFLENLQLAAEGMGRDFDPFKELMELYFAAKDNSVLEVAVPHLFKMMEYMFAKKRSVEVTGKDGGAIEFESDDIAAKFDKLAGVTTAAALLEDGAIDNAEAGRLINNAPVRRHDE